MAASTDETAGRGRTGLLGRLLGGRGRTGDAPPAPRAETTASARAWANLLDGLRDAGLTVSTPPPAVRDLSALPDESAVRADPLAVAAGVCLQHAVMVLLPVASAVAPTAAPRSGPWRIGEAAGSDLPNPLPVLDQVMAAVRERADGVPVQGLAVALATDAWTVRLPGRVARPADVLALLADAGGGGDTLPAVAAAWAALTGSQAEAEAEPEPDTDTDTVIVAAALPPVADPAEPDTEPDVTAAPGHDTDPDPVPEPVPHSAPVPASSPPPSPQPPRAAPPLWGATPAPPDTVAPRETAEATETPERRAPPRRTRPFRRAEALRLADELSDPDSGTP
ncbi:hypothetical protein [Roseospira navarrensis]|uniref:Uncharacterized protein n=1 Tax=Roseospira navarrensis TaxID=140058 RepID=A0A7X1ZAQ5_9PROT|nr:hypothetical protein [Roseospira navarrensis]MQX35111.1 hypothetical protein [Roseospira navarrensis]